MKLIFWVIVVMQRIGGNDTMFVCNHITYGFKDRKNGPSLYSSGQIKSGTPILVKFWQFFQI